MLCSFFHSLSPPSLLPLSSLSHPSLLPYPEVPGLIPVESSVEAFSGDTVTLSTFISTTNGLLTYVQWKDPSGDTILEYPALGEEVNALPSNLVISDASLEESGTYNVTVQSREGLNFRGHTLIFLSVLGEHLMCIYSCSLMDPMFCYKTTQGPLNKGHLSRKDNCFCQPNTGVSHYL